MKELLNDLNKAFENRVRLGIMSVLLVNASMDFNQLKDVLGVTDGNLATHLKHLEKKKFITVEKQFIERKPNTRYAVTDSGKRAFEKHIHAIEQLLK